MTTKMKTVRILIPILLVFVLLSSASVVLATDRLTFTYAVPGHIDNRDTGVGASMFLTLKGTLTLGTPDYDDEGWSEWREEDRDWNNYGGGYDWWFSWADPNIPQWVKDWGFNPLTDHQYRAHVDFDTHEHWWDHCQVWSYRWYTPRGSWSGQLVAMWNGGTAPETFSVSLSFIQRVEKELRQGNMYMTGDSWTHEKWDIYWVNTGGPEEHVGTYEGQRQIGGSAPNYYSETLRISFNGKFTTKGKRFNGWLYLEEGRWWTNPPPYPEPLGSPSRIGLHGSGEFGRYSFNFQS